MKVNSLNHKINTLIVIVGPTAVGKTNSSVELARHFKTEVISADSRQFYQEISIGTARPSVTEMRGIKHHFINFLPLDQEYDVFRYEREVLQLLERIFQSKKTVILTGGSGLYVKAVCEGIDEIPDVDPEVRRNLKIELQEHGLEALQTRLKTADPLLYQNIDLQNPARVLRGLEIFASSGKPLSSFQTGKVKPRPFRIIKIGLERPREELYQRINQRMDQMIAAGLFAEAEKYYPVKHYNSLKTVGYQEIFGYLDGEYDHEEAVRLLKRNSRRYAKRQMTWFKKDPEITWFQADEYQQVIEFIESVF